jgi:phosphatidylglycerol---prolipoprotein diacylglyceryl transferase
VQPGIDLLGLELKTFGLMFALAFVVSGLIVGRGLREAGKPQDWAYEMVFAALAGGLLGARAYWLIENAGDLEGGVLSNLFSGSGLVWYGGALGGAAGILLWAWWRGMLSRTMLDICAPALALGYAVGRLGCQLSGDGDYGKPWDGPWAMAYPDGVVPTDTPVHPTPLYETLSMALVGWVLWRSRKALRPGLLLALYLVLAGLERFFVEFLRRNDPGALGLTTPQWTALAMTIAGATWLAVAASRGGVRAAPAAA